jgi:4-hydroxybenzoate polyprenyltransferase
MSIGGLVRASHLGPCLAITAMAVLFAVAVGASDGLVLGLFTLAVLAGQLSIGWSNDYYDADLDRAAGRTDKPVAAGAITARQALVAAVVSLAISIGLSFWLGVCTGLLSLVVVGAGWAYNARLKGTVASGLMYILGFGPIPALATSVLPGHPLPPWWTVAAASLLGLGGHFANVLPDLAGDAAGGVRGLPQRVAAVAGPLVVRLTALVLLLAATVLITLGAYHWLALVGLGAALALGLVGVRAGGRTPFLCALGIAGIDVVMLLISGARLV